MWYIFNFLMLLGFSTNHAAEIDNELSSDIVLTTVSCTLNEKSVVSQKQCNSQWCELSCSVVVINKTEEEEMRKKINTINSCKIDFLKNNDDVSLHIWFDPTMVVGKIEKVENKEGDSIAVCYLYDKKIIDMLELY